MSINIMCVITYSTCNVCIKGAIKVAVLEKKVNYFTFFFFFAFVF